VAMLPAETCLGAKLRAMGRFIVLAAAIAAFGCSKKKADGLAPAQDWNAEAPAMVQMGSAPANPHGTELPKGHPAIPANMAGASMEGGTVPPLPAPDPNRTMDPSHYVK